MENPQPASQDVARFLSIVQPAGIHYLAYMDGGCKHLVYRAPEEAITLFGRRHIQGCDTYFALASFKQEKKPVPGQTYQMADRTQSNVDKLRSIWFDLDFKDYTSKAEATQHLVAFLREAPLPKFTYMVQTGGGYHLYWAVDRDLDPPEWLVLARALREMLKAKGVRADYQCTVDSARILRLPGSVNYKRPPETPVVTILGGSELQYSYEEISAALADYTVLPTTLGGDLGVSAEVVQLFGGQQTNVQDLDRRVPFYMAHVATGCGVVADSLAREGAGDAYPLWKNLLHLASFAEDGREYIHALSRRGDGYSVEDTDSRFEESLNAAANNPGLGPTLCETFSGLSPKCATCPLRGSIKTPAGIKVVTTPETGEVQTATPDHLDPSFVERGITFTLVREAGEDGESRFSRKVVLDKALENFQYGEDQGIPLLQFTYSNGIFTNHVELKAPEVYDTATFKAVMSRAGVMFAPAQERILQGVFVAWLSKLQKTQEHRTQPSFGWVYNQEHIMGYAHNGVLYKTDGTTAPSGSVDAGMKSIYSPSGDKAVWEDLARKVELDERPAIHMLVATTFGSPLMKLGSDANAFTFNFFSPQSGVGKSSNLKFAQAVWGHPVKAGSSLDDTPASVAQKVGKTTGLPGYWDELPKDRVRSFVEIMFQVTQGKTRQRLDTTGRLRETYAMTGFLVTNSNTPIMDDVLAYREGTAGLYRFFQVQVPTRANSTANFDPLFDSKVSKLEQNFGHMGERYAKYLSENVTLVESTMEKVRELVIQRLGHDEMERFWRHALVCLVSGAMLASRAGIMNLDHKAIFSLFEDLVHHGRIACGAAENKVNDVAAEVLHDYQQNLVVVEHMAAKGGNRYFTTRLLHAPPNNMPIKIQIAIEDGKIVIPYPTLEEYCKRRERSFASTANTLTETLGAEKRKLTMATGTNLAATQSRLWCYVLDMQTSMSQSEIDWWKRKVSPDDAQDTVNTEHSVPDIG